MQISEFVRAEAISRLIDQQKKTETVSGTSQPQKPTFLVQLLHLLPFSVFYHSKFNIFEFCTVV